MSIEVRELTAGYGNNESILNNLDIKIKKGCLCTLLGRNGSGKTTLFRCIGGLLKPRRGTIYVEGNNIDDLRREQIARLISFVPQKTTSVFSYTVLEMVVMGETARVKAWGKPTKDAYERAMNACEEVGIAHLIDKRYNELSGGEQQLVLIARAIMQNAQVMLLDEPTTHLDFCNQHKIMGMLVDFAKKNNITALITLHDPNLAVSYCDEVIMINEGNIINAGDMDCLFNDKNLKEVFGDIIKTDFTSEGYKVAVSSNSKRPKTTRTSEGIEPVL